MYSKALRYTVFGSRKKPSSAKRQVYTYVLEWIFFFKNGLSAMLLAKIGVSQG
jgi:hypothetical protein